MPERRGVGAQLVGDQQSACEPPASCKPTAARTRSRLVSATVRQGGSGFLLEARAFGGCSNLDDRGIAGDTGGSPGSFARIRRSIFTPRRWILVALDCSGQKVQECPGLLIGQVELHAG